MITTILSNKENEIAQAINLLSEQIKTKENELKLIQATQSDIETQLSMIENTITSAKDILKTSLTDYSDRHISDIDINKEIETLILNRLNVANIKQHESQSILPVKDITLSPKKFQYKIMHGKNGSTGSLTGIKWDPQLSGVIHVWYSPTDNLTYCINGHNRLNLAVNNEVESVNVKFIDCENEHKARLIGALLNISENSGNILDAAKIFRDYDISSDDLRDKYNISLSNKIAGKAMVLARLESNLFNKVLSGEFDINHALLISEKISDHNCQMSCYDILCKNKQSLSSDLISELVDMFAVKSDDIMTPTLFGDQIDTKKMIDKLKLCNHVVSKLSTDKRLFSQVAKNSNELERANNLIDQDSSKEIADLSEFILNIFNAYKFCKSGISSLINEVNGLSVNLSVKKELLVNNIMHYGKKLYEVKDQPDMLLPNSEIMTDIKLLSSFESKTEGTEYVSELVVKALSKRGPCNIEQLVTHTKMTISELSSALLLLEIEGKIIKRNISSWSLSN